MVVMVVITVLLLGGLVAMQHVMGYLPIAKADEQRQAALAAAQAGVDDYVNRLNQDPDYWYGGYYNNGYDDAAATNVAMRTGPWGWVPVEPGSPAEFHYSVDTTDLTSYKETNSSTASWGTIFITSTGKVGNVTRTVQVGVRQSDFLSNLYLSNYNLVDPNLFFAMGDAPSLAAADDCVDYGYQANPDPPSPYSPATPSNPGGLPDPYFGPANPNNWSLCTFMINYWITGNVVNGPMQSEDDYYFSGTPVFKDRVMTVDPSPSDYPYWKDPVGIGGGYGNGDTFGGPSSDNPEFDVGGGISTIQSFKWPDSPMSFIGPYASTTDNPTLGCLYYGPTAIRFSGNSMYVYSPDTAGSNTGCLGTGPTPWQQPLSLPANGVIYVENVPTPLPGNGTCTDTPSWAEFNDGPPASNDPNGTGTCLGNAFVEGTVDGQVTVAADNNIYVVGPPSDASATTVGAQSEEGGDVVGLVAGNDVFVNHDTNAANDGGCAPAQSGDDCFGPLAFAPIVQNPTINAVVFAMTGSLDTTYFWGGGTMGNMTINGAIVGNFMDCEGVFSGSGSLVDGYNEIYNWDSRLPHLSPPFFIPPNAPSWMETTYSELPAQNG